jgi:tripartite-type tricarboxylate transporter receptor subunit TctC
MRHINSALALALVCTISTFATPSFAQEWPTRPVKILVGSAPGGGTDAMARAVADRLGPLLKQPVVVENRPGVSNTLAADVTAKSTDGHTMVMGVSTAHAIAPHLIKLGYDSNKDLVPVAFVGAVPNVLVANNALAVDSVASLVKLAKSKPGQLNYATSGSGSTQHIAAELFKDVTGVFITHLPYGIYMPASTPKEVQDKVNAEVNKLLAMPETKARLDGIGAEITPMTQAQFLAFHNAEFQRFGELIRKKNIKLD